MIIIQSFSLKPNLHEFQKFKEFIDEFKIGKGDFILTHKPLYKGFMEELGVQGEIMFQEEYGHEPSDEMINKIIKDQKSNNYKRIIAIGGGSVIDIAKVIALKNMKKTSEIFEKDNLIKDKELIVVPTTCGTGSEVTNITIMLIESLKSKKGLADDALYPDDAVLIPELLEGLPYEFFVFSSIDALIHAIESLLSPKSNKYTSMFSLKAVEMILKGYKKIIEEGKEYRTKIIRDFLIASNYAGIAFANAGVGAVHALSYPLGGKYHVPHGEANYQFFIEVLKIYNEKNTEGKIKELNYLLSNILELKTEEDPYIALEDILNKMLPKKNLREYGMKESDIEIFSEIVINQQQRLLKNNYTSLSKDDIRKIYKERF